MDEFTLAEQMRVTISAAIASLPRQSSRDLVGAMSRTLCDQGVAVLVNLTAIDFKLNWPESIPEDLKATLDRALAMACANARAQAARTILTDLINFQLAAIEHLTEKFCAQHFMAQRRAELAAMREGA